jgi:predicted O-methyltransferase YrrM
MVMRDAPVPLERLPGTEHARFALPLEYPPSRDLTSRWGFSRPPIEPLYSWLSEHADAYRAFLAEMRRFGQELVDLPRDLDPALLPRPAWMGVAMNPIDSLALYSFVRSYRPATYLEIGSGVTTCFAHLARERNQTLTRIISIDPEPRAAIDAICDDVIRAGLENCDLAIFDSLVAGDIVFMDGSHRSFMNSDVTVFFIDVLPRLKSGVIVHLHDIALPYDYHPFFTNWYWNEQYLLAVYMMGNRARIRPLLPLALITFDPMFATDVAEPFIATAEPLLWISPAAATGGSMWFTHI